MHTDTVHEGEKLFKCAICDLKYSNKTHLRRHISTAHNENRPFKCDSCDLAFNLKQSLKAHIMSVHEKKIPLNANIVKKLSSSTQE
jgi:uncharacterized C2H2 Zn-finger protein